MSALRRLAVAGAFALPLSLVIACPATADPLGWPDEGWSAESSGSWAGIGGAGTTDTEEGSDWWGHHWSETETAVAGIGGAAVTHSGESGWDSDDDYDAPAVARPHHVVGHPDPVMDEAPAVRPVYDTSTDDTDADDVGYAAESHSAGVDGASSAHVVSHAGEHHAVYEAEKLTAGPYGASSEGAHSVAVPDYAGHHSWYTAAGVDGAEAHSVTAVADADDWTVDHAVHHYFDDDQG
ncbi:hypothetical protein [Amycolatopsis sp. NPDC021455]|uniref:hypothetical protein n=1 Tax=Amycolatopsis sp. NPDC021455 TaxID=3154901 RepID=UPI0033D38BD0